MVGSRYLIKEWGQVIARSGHPIRGHSLVMAGIAWLIRGWGHIIIQEWD